MKKTYTKEELKILKELNFKESTPEEEELLKQQIQMAYAKQFKNKDYEFWAMIDEEASRNDA